VTHAFSPHVPPPSSRYRLPVTQDQWRAEEIEGPLGWLRPGEEAEAPFVREGIAVDPIEADAEPVVAVGLRKVEILPQREKTMVHSLRRGSSKYGLTTRLMRSLASQEFRRVGEGKDG
jgi:hypothetical protein